MQPVEMFAPSSKSFTHRAMIAAALARGASFIHRPLKSEDTARTREVLSIAGAIFEQEGETMLVRGIGGAPGVERPLSGGMERPFDKDGEALSDDFVFSSIGPEPGDGVVVPGLAVFPEAKGRPPLHDAAHVFVGESGSTCRLLLPVLAAGRGTFFMHGARRMSKRPLSELLDVLASLGARLWRGGDSLPLLLEARGLEGRDIEISCESSSQFLSGLLLAAPLCRGGLNVSLSGERAVSWPYVRMTVEVMRSFGAACLIEVPDAGPAREESSRQGGWIVMKSDTPKRGVPGRIRFRVPAGGYRSRTYRVEGDWSAAACFLAAGALGPLPVRVRGLDLNSSQGDAAIVDILSAMGAKLILHDDGVSASPSPLRGVNIDLGSCPDLAPVVAVLASHAGGSSRFSGLGHLRFKECDRMRAIVEELARAGRAANADGGELRIEGGSGASPVQRPLFATRGDHRMAMALCLFGLAGLKSAGADTHHGVNLDDPECVRKSFPEFWSQWRNLTRAIRA